MSDTTTAGLKQPNVTLKRSDAEGWEQVVFAEVLIPETPNVFGDYWTKQAVRDAAYAFMRKGFGIDVEHDNVNIAGSGAYMVETFIVRPGDPTFIEGSWVIALKITDDDLWQQILDNEINGFSYEATLNLLPGTYYDPDDDGMRTGFTEPDITDGHVHGFAVFVDETNRPIFGGTDEANGHKHTISSHTVTDVSEGHSHRYNIVTKKES